jgi:ferredoxin
MVSLSSGHYAVDMATITHVWIEEGCIACGYCPIACPEIFDIPNEDAEIRGSARMDGITSPNRIERSRLNEAGLACTDGIEEAVAGCPVEVIQFLRE